MDSRFHGNDDDGPNQTFYKTITINTQLRAVTFSITYLKINIYVQPLSERPENQVYSSLVMQRNVQPTGT